MAKTIRIVCYAVNGGGVGHLTRLVAMARWMRRYAAHAGCHAEIIFLTSSEADTVLYEERFASFKIPSKTAAQAGGLDKTAYLAMAKQWIWHSLALLRPDIFVVDTFPRGSFGELIASLDLCKKKVFVYRPVKPELSGRPEFQSMLPLYDLVLVPERTLEVLVPPAAEPRTRAIGSVAVRERGEMRSREDARRRLALPADAFVIHASAGGGGDPGAEADLSAVMEAFGDDPDVHLVIGAGPLYRGSPLYGPRVRFVTQLGAAELLRAADVAISAAGYNAYTELMLAEVPTVFVPQPKVADDQRARAERARDAGAGSILERPLTAAALRDAVLPFRSPRAREAASRAAKQLGEATGARRGAREILQLCLGASALEAAEMAMDDVVIETARSTGIDEAVFVELMHALDTGPDDLPPLDPKGASAGACAVVRALAQHGAPVTPALRAVLVLLRRVQTGAALDRAAAACAIVDALAPFGDWPGAHALLRAVPLDGLASPTELVAPIVAEVAAARAEGGDLYRAIARLVKSSHAPPRGFDSEASAEASVVDPEVP